MVPTRCPRLADYIEHVMDWLDELGLPSGPLRARLGEASRQRHRRQVLAAAIRLVLQEESCTCEGMPHGPDCMLLQRADVESWSQMKWDVDRHYDQRSTHRQGEQAERMVVPLSHRDRRERMLRRIEQDFREEAS